MDGKWNPEIPANLQKNFEREKEQAFTLYLDFVVDGTASMYTVFPAVYYAAAHFLECLSKYEVYPKLGLTVIRNEKNGEECETALFEGKDFFTSDLSSFLKKLKGVKLYGGGNDGRESVHSAIGTSVRKFPSSGRNKAILVFTDAYGSNDYEEYLDNPIGQVIFFSTDEMSEEDFRFCFVKDDGELDEEASPMFIRIDKLLKPMSTEFLDNIVKPLKDLMKGVSIGA
ncbi:MAG: hypothetical protein MR867_05180 [Eubacterium sp.]|nr:hypothetical protein [Eubacterium sp.]MDD7210312.1 hypothetical protein [Lachnospiraceae bacterium]MDY5496866.1 hypothetical protein [Anaerobutyricum sp.]